NPWGYHLLNVLVHGLNAALFCLVARRLLAAAAGAGASDSVLTAGAVVAALVFALHPLRVEPVAWVTGRADLLCAAFLLLATLAYLRAIAVPGPAPAGRMAVCALAFTAAMLSKGSALPFPAALLLVDVFPLRRWRRVGWRALLAEKTLLFAVAAVGAAVVAYATRRGAVATGADEYGVIAGITVAAYAFVISLVRFVWPAALSPLYEMPRAVSPLEPRFGLAVCAALVLTAGLIALRRRWPGGLAAWL